jgi:predicted CXXCH cytochrome family protein
LVDVYPDSLAFVQVHVFDEYATAWGNDRWAFNSGTFTPLAVFNGIDPVVGAVSNVDQQYTIYRTNHFLPERARLTDVSIDLTAEDLGGGTYRVTALVGIEADGTAKTLRIYVVQVLDHWPDTPNYHRNTFKQATPTQDITLAPGDSQTVESTFTFDADSWTNRENIKIVAWAQGPAGSAPAEVYQAATRVWPLISSPGDADGDGIPDAADNCPQHYNPGQVDTDADEVGDLCDDCVTVTNPGQGDTDEDSFGDVCDNCPLLHHHDQTESDGDGVGDVCDSCPEIVARGGVDPFGRARGTIDPDCDVDRFDVTLFGGCFTGPGVTTPPPACNPDDFARSDLDSDGDVDMNDLPVLALNLTGPLPSPALYMGVAACAECHSGNHMQWAETNHATAFDTLVAYGEGDNELCFPCHSMGYGLASGFVDLDTTPHLANVQCENCHGPGSNHAGDPNDVPMQIDMDANLCGACHQSCHGLCGEDHHPQFEQWSTSAHSTALIDIQFDPDAQDDCLPCHSTDYRLAPSGDKPTLLEALYDIECVACHDPHGGENVGQLRLPPMLLCADCHTMDGAVPNAEPDQPQVEMLHGSGGFGLEGTPLDGPYSEHWWGVADECVTCHVHKESYGGPDQPLNSGHTFEANMRACGPCHSETTATLLVAAAREEMKARLAEIAHYLDPADPLYVDPSTLTLEELAQYEIAVFNYEFVKADRSYGSHNAYYARALLAETEAFFGITPWLLNGRGGPNPLPKDDSASSTSQVEVCQ